MTTIAAFAMTMIVALIIRFPLFPAVIIAIISLSLYNSYAITVVEDNYTVKVSVNKNVITKTHI